MKPHLAPISLLACLATPALGQTEVVYSIQRPAQISSSWGKSLTSIGDLDGDGIDDVIVATFGHAQLYAGSVHSGADGALLYLLATPYVPLFWADAIVAIADENGDGLQEIVVIGAHSGDANSPNGRFRVYSGVDGSLMREVDAPPGVFLTGNMQAGSLSLGDIDGDGSDDLLVRNAGGVTGFSASVLSSKTGAVLYSVVPQAPASLTGDFTTRLSDHDGDARADFALVMRESGRTRIEIHSAANGALLSILKPAGIEVLTGNGETFLGISDLDGDGLRDIAVGGVFAAYAALHSSANGNTLQQWTCTLPTDSCLGRSMVEVQDFTGDGKPDLLALETNPADFNLAKLFGVDPVTGEVVFEQVAPGLGGGYSSSKRMISAPGIDADGFVTVAMVVGVLDVVEVRRILPEIGRRGCASVANSTGSAAQLFAYGSASLSTQSLSIAVTGAVPNEPGYLFYGSQASQTPYGNGFLCVGGQVGRIAPMPMDGAGSALQSVDFEFIGASPVSWTFQAMYRDSVTGSFNSTDAITIEFVL